MEFARFVECLLTLINPNKNDALKMATELIDKFDKIYEEKWFNMMKSKIGQLVTIRKII